MILIFDNNFPASIYTLFFVIGSLMSSFLDPLGRKKTLMLGNIPYFIGWLSLYYSNSLWSIYITLAIMGITSGSLEAAVVLYISEISLPSIRTILLTSTNFAFELGAALIYMLGNRMPWRDATLICASVPVGAILIMIIVSFFLSFYQIYLPTYICYLIND